MMANGTEAPVASVGSARTGPSGGLAGASGGLGPTEASLGRRAPRTHGGARLQSGAPSPTPYARLRIPGEEAPKQAR